MHSKPSKINEVTVETTSNRTRRQVLSKFKANLPSLPVQKKIVKKKKSSLLCWPIPTDKFIAGKAKYKAMVVLLGWAAKPNLSHSPTSPPQRERGRKHDEKCSRVEIRT